MTERAGQPPDVKDFKCERCGADVLADSAFCPDCGNPVSRVVSGQEGFQQLGFAPVAKTSGQLRVGIIIAVVGIGVILTSPLFVFHRESVSWGSDISYSVTDYSGVLRVIGVLLLILGGILAAARLGQRGP